MEIDAITEYKGVGKLGWLCQKHKLQHPNHVKVSLLGLLTDYFTVAICGRIVGDRSKREEICGKP